MTDPLLIVAALNGTRGADECPKVPLSPQDLGAEARRAVEAGAGLVHVHARTSDGAPSFDFVIDDIVAAIRGAVDVPISISTQRARQTSLGTVTALFGVLSDLPDVAAVHVRPPEPDLPAHREEARQILEALEGADVRPAPVAGSLDAIGDLQALYQDQLLGRAPFLLLGLGGPTSESSDLAAGTPQNALHLIDAAHSALAGLPIVAGGRDASSPVVQAVAAAAGEHIRVGFEDAITLPNGEAATSNAQLVEHAVRLGAALGRAPMAPAEARRLLR
ncbi:MAG: 3-keto-5-aminohexanoate cleavage protein [Gaiellales bacterium]